MKAARIFCAVLKNGQVFIEGRPSVNTFFAENLQISEILLIFAAESINNWLMTTNIIFKKWVLSILMFIPLSANAEEIGGIRYYLDSRDHHAEVLAKYLSDPNPYTGDIVIPNTISHKDKSYEVTAINSGAFRNCTGLRSVSLPGSIETIEDGAFWGCTGLTTVSLAHGLITIESNAFYGCSSLQNISLPSSVKTIGKYAFSGCTSLTSCSLDCNIKLGTGVFSDCTGLTSIQLSGGKTIKDYLFCGCTSLTSVIIPEGIRKIESYAFSGCSNLKRIVLPNSLDSICDRTFNRTAIEYLKIPHRVKFIGDYAFYKCENLKEIDAYPSTPPDLRSASFSDYDNISLYVPESYIEKYKNAPLWKLFFNVSAKSPGTGDTNGDGSVNQTDLEEVIKIIIGDASGDYNTEAADLNGDGVINVIDIVLMLNIINQK